MKRSFFKLMSMGLALLTVILFTPIDAYAKDYVLADNELSYEQYFENEHGFYSDNITKTQKYSTQLPQLLPQNISKSSKGSLLYNGKLISGIIGNSEMGFFSVGHTVYRYHVKSKIIDKLFTEENMESFYPISSHVILWKRAETHENITTLVDNEKVGAGVYFSYDIRDGESRRVSNPEQFLALTKGRGYTNLSSYSVQINGTAVPLSSYPIGSYYTGSNNGSTQCRGFSWLVYQACWGSY